MTGEDGTSLCDYGVIVVVSIHYVFSFTLLLKSFATLLSAQEEVHKDQRVPDDCQQETAVTTAKTNLTTHSTLHEYPVST